MTGPTTVAWVLAAMFLLYAALRLDSPAFGAIAAGAIYYAIASYLDRRWFPPE